jgi:hypothetical protein
MEKAIPSFAFFVNQSWFRAARAKDGADALLDFFSCSGYDSTFRHKPAEP